MQRNDFAAWILAVIFSLLGWVGNGYSQSPDSRITPRCEIPIQGDGSPILINVDHLGRKYRFLFDTGAAFTILDTATFRGILKPHPVDGSKLFGTTPPPGYINPGNFVVGENLVISANPLYHTNLSSFTEACGEKLHGVQGSDFLNEFVIDADFDVGRLRLMPGVQHQNRTCIELHRDTVGRPIFDATLNDLNPPQAHVEFLLDTGYVGLSGVTLRKELFTSYFKQGLLEIEGESQVAQLASRDMRRSGTLKHFSAWNKTDGIQVDEKAGAQMNMLGLTYLAQFNFELDLPNSKIYIQPRKGQSHVLQRKDMCGLGFRRSDVDLIVQNSYPQSPAARADIREGDIISSVDRVDSQKLGLHALRVSLSEPGKLVTFGVRRGTKEWMVTIKLEDWQKPATAKDFE